MKLLKLILLLSIISNSHSSTGRFLHITDIHYDPSYSVGSPNNCILGSTGLGCCHKYDMPKKPYSPANLWGDYSCDTNYHLVNKTFEWITNNLEPIDFIIYTGDSVNHHDLSQSISFNIKSLRDINNLFKIHFPNKTVYSSIGNHDTYPIDQTPYFIKNYFFKHFADEWTYWLDKTTYSTINKGGYYISKLSSNMYILNFNSLFYDTNNIFTKNQNLDYAEQWFWLETTLNKIKNEGSYVWITNHICPHHSEASNIYTNKFINIISKYKDIVKYQFYGHTHSDTFTLFRQNNLITGFGSIPSSLMLDKQEGSFRIYDYDRDSFNITNYHQYSSDLKNTIKNNRIIYNKTYSFNEEYDLNGVNLNNWISLYNKLKTNSTILNKYYNHLSPGKNNNICDNNCKKNILKDILP